VRTAAVAVVAAVFVLVACTGGGAKSVTPTDGRTGWPPRLRMAVSATSGADAGGASASLARLLHDDLGLDVDVIELPDTNLTEAPQLLDGSVDVVELGPASYLGARERGARYEVVAAEVSAPGSEPGYYSDGYARAGEGVSSLGDVAGRRVCLVDERSAAGYVVPRAALRAAHAVPSTVVVAGRPRGALESVVNHDCDVAFVPSGAADTTPSPVPGLLVFWQSPLIPTALVTTSSNLPPTLQTATRDVLSQRGNADEFRRRGYCTDKCGNASGGWGYTAAADAITAGLRSACPTFAVWPCPAAS
jgi:phosphonate transport system substrate-binding protein